MKVRLFQSVLLGLLLFAAGTVALAQSTGSIRGTVADASGALVPKANVTAQQAGTNLERKTVTDSAGIYSFPALPVGTYRVEVRAAGFQTLVRNGIVVNVNQTVALNISLKVGEVSQSVTVEGGAPVIQTDTITVGTVINQTSVQELPLNARHFVDLGNLLPGSVVAPANGFLTAPLRGLGAFAFNTAGGREDTVNFMINGINLNDMVQNQITFQPSINTVAEFKADNSTFSAESGRSSGAIVNIATRSGTNGLHGEVFEYLRNEKLDARNFFADPAAPKDPFKRNNYGVSAGGPFWIPGVYDGRNRTFWFFSYEGLRQRQRIPFKVTVPTNADRASVTDPTVVKLLPLFPQANQPDGQTFIGGGVAPVNLNQWTFDFSHRLSAEDSLHGYYAIQQDLRMEPGAGANVPGFGDTRPARRQIFTFDETHIFSTRVVNEFRFGLNRITIGFLPNALLNPQDFGINDGITGPEGIPRFSVSGSINFGGPNGRPQGRHDTTFVWSDTLSYLLGKHSLKFGGEVRAFQNNNNFKDIGRFTFNSIQKFIAGNADSFTINSAGIFSGVRQKSFAGFLEDSYKLKANLTLQLGFRYEANLAPTEQSNRFILFDPATDSLVQAGTNGISERPYGNQTKNFSPRFGFAWDPWNDGKTSLRAGYGVYFDQPVTNAVTGLSSNPPFGNPISASGGGISVSDPLAGAGSSASTSPSNINPDFANDYVQQWNFNVQREITPSLAVMVGYIGSKGTHLRKIVNQNQKIVSSDPLVNGMRPFPGFNNIAEVDSPGNSSYNALWVSVTKHMSRGLQFGASYSFSHSIDINSTSSADGFPQDSTNLAGERGPSDFDTRHHFNVHYVYELPFKGNRAVEGWELTGAITAQSGNPLSVFVNGSGPTGSASRRANIIGDPSLSNPDPAQWFNTAAFCAPGSTGCTGPTVFGNSGRNIIVGPRFSDVDFALIKNTKLTELFNLQFRAEFFNLLNHPNFGNPALTVGPTNFGEIQETRTSPGDFGSSRQIQFALRLKF